MIEGNAYFPSSSLKKEYFKNSSTHSTCPWKGEASYYSVEVDGDEIPAMDGSAAEFAKKFLEVGFEKQIQTSGF